MHPMPVIKQIKKAILSKRKILPVSVLIISILCHIVGLPACASDGLCPAFSGFPNDWLSPTDIALDAYGHGLAGPLTPFPC